MEKGDSSRKLGFEDRDCKGDFASEGLQYSFQEVRHHPPDDVGDNSDVPEGILLEHPIYNGHPRGNPVACSFVLLRQLEC